MLPLALALIVVIVQISYCSQQLLMTIIGLDLQGTISNFQLLTTIGMD